MAQSARAFRETLCESRGYPVETTDPTGARMIDELRRQVKELSASLEGEKMKRRQLVREHEKKLHQCREEEAVRLDTSLDACAARKDQEKAVEIKKLLESWDKQKEQDIRQLNKEKAVEVNKQLKKWQLEKNEAVKIAMETEKRRSLDEFNASFSGEEALAREDKLTREVFILGEQNDSLEQQIKNLSRLNRAQIDQMRRMKHECESRIDEVIRQHKTEASREVAQLKLAEQIIAEKDHDLHSVEYRAEMALVEKEALEEELVAMKSIHNTSNVSFQDTQTSSTPTRRSVGGGGSLQRRVEELDALVKKLDEEKGNLKRDNVALRKKLLHEDGEKKGDGKISEDKIKQLRKRNSELTSLCKELEDKVKTLKADMEQLQSKGSSGETEQNIRKNLARQHVHDVSEYTKQIHAKDRQLTEIKKKVDKLEAAALAHSEPTPELEKKVKSMSIEKLHMEKLITKLYSRLPDSDSSENLSRKDLVVESSKMEELTSENESLHSQIQELRSSLEAAREAKDHAQGQPASNFESECHSLKKTVEELEAANSVLEQTCHELRQKLKISTLAVKELEESHDNSSGFEGEVQDLREQVQDLRGQAKLKDNEMMALKEESREAAGQITGKQTVITVLQKQIEELEETIKEKDSECSQLHIALDDVQSSTKPSIVTADIGIQFHKSEGHQSSQTVSQPESSTVSPSHRPPAPQTTTTEVAVPGKSETTGKRFNKERIHSPIRRSMRSHSPRTSSRDLLDSSLDNEMRAAGVEINDSFDSSEAIGFSDTNLDVSVVEERDQSREERFPRTAWEKGEEVVVVGERAGQAQTTNGSSHHEEPLKLDEDDGGAVGGGAGAVDEQKLLNNLLKRSEVGVADESGSGHLSNGSDGDLIASPSKDSDGTHTPQSENDKVGIYIAKYSYNPSEMSPNPTFDLELPLTAGDYLCVYGDMDDDGFYHGQLMTGQSGMVPSNFIERVVDEDELESSHLLQKQSRGHSSLLQDIVEVDEDTSSGGMGSIPPPRELMLDRQYVESDNYSVALRWERPHPLPEGVTGYCVYVNGEHNRDVIGADQTDVFLTGIPRKQLVKVSVRTTTEEGESADPQKLIILNPQYPEAPKNVEVSKSLSPRCLNVRWIPTKPLAEGNPISSYTIYLNNQSCVKLGPCPTSAKTVYGQVLASDITRDLKDSLLKSDVISLSVCSESGDYISAPSLPILVPKEDLVYVLGSGKMTTDESEITSSATSLSSMEDEEEEEEKELFSPAKRGILEGGEEIEAVDGVGVSNGVSTSPPPLPSSADNGKELQSDDHTGPVKYYRALARYDPHLQSPNEDGVDEELAFFEDDIIVGITDVDVDGYLIGELNGKEGYIPSNLLEEVTDQEELAGISTLLQAQANQRHGNAHLQNHNGIHTEDNSSQKMKAVFDYDPALDSPNENSEVELTLNEGDIVMVFGKPDEDGFFKAEVAGKKGLVPSNFLEAMSSPKTDEIEVFAADVESMRIADAIIQQRIVEAGGTNSNPPQSQSGTSSKRKGGGRLKNLLGKRRGD